MSYSQGAIRRIRLGDSEVLRHIYFAVRDRNWGTVPASVISEEVRDGERDFSIRILVEHKKDDIHFRWDGLIRGFPDNRITFSVDGEPCTEFLRNRIGLCVLHPLKECVDRECSIEHTDGTVEKSRFPSLISPHQPFFDIRAISYSPIAEMTSTVKFAGETFETEDHRNWSDGSFKTYSTPLSIRYPVRVRPGEQIQQEIEFAVAGQILALHDNESPCVNIAVDRTRIYRIGAVGVVWEKGHEGGAFSHLRVDIRFEDGTWRETITLAAMYGIALEIAAFTDNAEDDLSELHSVLELMGAKPARLMVFTRNGDLSDPNAVEVARGIFRELSVGGGSCANFAELNRNREIGGRFDFLAWPVNPRVHANDDESMIDNLEGQAPAIETARKFARGRPLCISPILTPDFRASSGWTTVSLKHLFMAGAASLTYRRPSAILREICEWQPEGIVSASSSDPSAADALVLRKAGRHVAWIANFRDEQQEVAIEGQQFSLLPNAVLRAELDR